MPGIGSEATDLTEVMWKLGATCFVWEARKTQAVSSGDGCCKMSTEDIEIWAGTSSLVVEPKVTSLIQKQSSSGQCGYFLQSCHCYSSEGCLVLRGGWCRDYCSCTPLYPRTDGQVNTETYARVPTRYCLPNYLLTYLPTCLSAYWPTYKPKHKLAGCLACLPVYLYGLLISLQERKKEKKRIENLPFVLLHWQKGCALVWKELPTLVCAGPELDQ